MKKKQATIILAILFGFIAAVFILRSQIEKPNGDPPVANGEYFFTAKIVETNMEVFYGEMFVVEVTDGPSNPKIFSYGNRVCIPFNTMSEFDCAELTNNEYIRVVFDGATLDSDPAQLGKIFDIYKTDESGNSV